MSVVVDSSVLVAALVDSALEEPGPRVFSPAGHFTLPSSYEQKPPMFCDASNVLSTLLRLKRHAAHDDLMQLDLELFPFEPFADRVWELRRNITSYDAWYVAVAEALHLPLATLDEKLAKASRGSCEVVTSRS